MSGPSLTLRLEGLAALVGSIVLFRHLGGHWGTFALLLFVPDVSMLGYLAGAHVGSVLYDALHSYLTVALLVLVALLAGYPAGLPLACILVAHIGLDRALGYGLKYATGFRDTHLQRV